MARAKVTLDEATGVVTVEDNGVVSTYDINETPKEIHGKFALHGLAQKLRDGVAGKTEANGFNATERKAVMDELFEAYKRGEYTRRGEGGGGSQLDTAAEAYRKGELKDADVKTLKGLGLYEKIVARAKKLEEKEAKK